ncbi:hypothetical protein [uncultured Winogradskyella sp.]|uniref:hypothetical protein n=1 Tax=uncultured Winogradskyella sp. TaxID=395353 RepID=UPI002637852F|nr:hypothetical protein [uncultured Winogradskyella sp.]
MIKKTVMLTILLFYTIAAFPQDENHLEILEADSTWVKEIIKFPLSFAPEINYEGYEDLRFAKNWRKPESPEFWTYVIAWNINLQSPPTVEMLEANLKLYYDGLMTAVNKDKDFIIPKTIISINGIKDKSLSYRGNMKVYDSFFTKEVINLNIDIETNYCEEQNKYVMLFRVSSLGFENSIWKILKEVRLIQNHCDK